MIENTTTKKKKRTIPKYYGINYPVIRMSDADIEDDEFDGTSISEGLLLEGKKGGLKAKNLLKLLKD